MISRHVIPKIPLTFLRFPLLPRRLSTRPPSTAGDPSKPPPPVAAEPRDDAYRQLENLDFATAAKILFSDSSKKKKKFGLDFHLVQLFFACMPSLAVYLVAQYARYEIRRMEAEVELKKKQAEEEEKAKEVESASIEERSDTELLKVKVRLDVLEEAVKEIVDEKKKTSSSDISKDNESGKKKEAAAADKISGPQDKSKVDEATSEKSRITSSGSSVAATK